MQRVEDVEVGCHEGTLTAVASREVLRGHDGDDLALEAAHEQNLAVVVGKIGGVDDLCDERPQFQCFVGGLVVEHQVEAGDETRLLDEEQSSDELLADREWSATPRTCRAAAASIRARRPPAGRWRNKPGMVYLSTAAKNPVCRRCVSLFCVTFAKNKHQSYGQTCYHSQLYPFRFPC